MTLTCPVCKQKFHKGKTNEFGRQSRHLWKNHPEYMKKKIKAGQRKKKRGIVRPLDKEFMAIDDILLALTAGTIPRQPQYDATHEQLGGLVLQALVPIITSAIASNIAKRKKQR